MDQLKESLLKLASNPAVVKVMTAAAAVFILAIAVRVIQRHFTRRIKESDTRYRAHKFVSFFGYVAGILAISIVYSSQLGALTVALGVAGAGVAFAMQEVIVSVAGWIGISLGGYYKTGDRIQLGGIRGDVIDIGVLRTTLMELGQWIDGDNYNGRIVRVANSFVFKEPVFNYSADFPFLWDEITLSVAHGSDTGRTRDILNKAMKEIVGDYVPVATDAWKSMVKKYLIENATVEPMVTMTATESAMFFTARYVVDFKKRRTTKDRIFSRVIEEIEKTDGKVSLSTSTLQLTETSVLNVRQEGKGTGTAN
ncbi:MAG: mechanosensitive ion channel domain-containing protein [Pseudomonadota bacterium]